MDVTDWGLIDFQEAWDKQRTLAENIEKGANDTLALCEHPDVITLGRTTKSGAVVAPLLDLTARGIPIVEIDRGGEATVHNPGQLVGYPIFNLKNSNPDLHWFLRSIEQCIIDALGTLGIIGMRVEGRTGVWVDGERKICAIGIHCRKWITTHGFALNVNNDLALFGTIVPCGIVDKGVTSISQELGHTVEMTKIRESVVKEFSAHFKNTSIS